MWVKKSKPPIFWWFLAFMVILGMAYYYQLCWWILLDLLCINKYKYIYIYIYLGIYGCCGDILRILEDSMKILLDGYVSDLRTLLINIYWYAICVYITLAFFIPPGFNMQPYRTPKIGSGKWSLSIAISSETTMDKAMGSMLHLGGAMGLLGILSRTWMEWKCYEMVWKGIWAYF